MFKVVLPSATVKLPTVTAALPRLRTIPPSVVTVSLTELLPIVPVPVTDKVTPLFAVMAAERVMLLPLVVEFSVRLPVDDPPTCTALETVMAPAELIVSDPSELADAIVDVIVFCITVILLVLEPMLVANVPRFKVTAPVLLIVPGPPIVAVPLAERVMPPFAVKPPVRVMLLPLVVEFNDRKPADVPPT